MLDTAPQTPPARRDGSVIAWLVPLACVAIGSWSWACQDSGTYASTGADSGDPTNPSGNDDDPSGNADDPSGNDDDPSGNDDDPSGNDDDPSGNDDDPSGDGGVDRGDVLESIAHAVVVPATAGFAEQAALLQGSAAAYASAMNTDPAAAEDERAAVQDSFRVTMALWQQLEVMQIGPAGPSALAIGGEDLRDELYSWPSVNTCRVDQRIADEGYATETFFADNLVNAYGLDALEYLVFVDVDAHTCPPQVQLDGPWSAAGPAEIARRRAAYAEVVATELARQGAALAERWSPAGGDFAGALAGPGGDGSPYESESQALDQVFRAMFYVDKSTKDAKLGRALGIADGCAAVPCPDLLESPFAGQAGPSLVANLRALRLLVTGGPDPATADGFDDLLANAGHAEIGDTLLADIDAAIALIEAEGETPLQAALVADVARVQALYDAVKKVTDTLKGPFVMVLRLTIPAEGAGDAD